MDAYVDHNFLIDCLNREGWREIARRAARDGAARFVRSPWSIYEIGSANRLRMEELLVIAEELSPSWILERVDLELREFVVAWNDFWNGTTSKFNPILTLQEVQASFFRCPIERVQGYSIADYANVWQREGAGNEADVEFRRQESISAFNRKVFENGKLDIKTITEIRKRYVARQFAISRRMRIPMNEIYEYENWILTERRLSTFISFFVEWGGMDRMPAHRVEESLTFTQWETDAKLNPHRQIDRIHAVAALPYCDLFVTTDQELTKKILRVRGGLPFKIAEVISGEDFIERYKKKS